MLDLRLRLLLDEYDGENDCDDFQRSGCGADGCDASLIPFSVAVDLL